MRVDNGGEVQFDGEKSDCIYSAVAYFDRLCAGHGSREGTPRNPKAVVNW